MRKKFLLFCVNIQVWKIWDNGDITGEYNQLYNIVTNESNLLLFPQKVVNKAREVAFNEWGDIFNEDRVNARVPHGAIKKDTAIHQRG